MSVNYSINENSGPPKSCTLDVWPVTSKRLPTPGLRSETGALLKEENHNFAERFNGSKWLAKVQFLVDFYTVLSNQLKWAPAEIFPRGGKSTSFCLSFSGCWRCNAN